METRPSKQVLAAREAGLADEDTVGGKALHLAWLSRHGYRVPPWVVVTTSGCAALLAQDGLDRRIQACLQRHRTEPEALFPLLGRLRQQILACPIPPAWRAGLAEALSCFPGWETQHFAVRSSVVGEDAARASFAGQMDSFLFQRGLPALERSILQCLASTYADRAVRYRLEQGLPLADLRTAVLIQVMIEGQVSGALFTAHPVTGSRKHALLTSCYGLGEGVVSGRCDADEFTVGLQDGTIEAVIRRKEIQVVFDREAGAGTRVSPVPDAQQAQPSLTPEQVHAITDLGLSVAGRRQAPQDVEWTLRDGRVYLLQTRPITALPPPRLPQGQRIVWDNSNIQESYCGVTTPLTFSFARLAYATVYRQTMRVMNLPARVLDAHRDVVDNLLGLIRGRIYYNINNWYRGLLLLPSFKTNKADMERMMGLQDPVDFVEGVDLPLAQQLRRLPRLTRTLARLLRHFRRLDRLVAAFEDHFETVYRRIDRARLHLLDVGELVDLTHMLRRDLLMQWSTPILNDFYVMMMNGRVHRTLEKLDAAAADALQNNLLAGEEGLESVEPTRQLLSLCEEIRREPALERLFREVPNDRLLAAVQTAAPSFYERCLQYLERYGDRGMGELKLETLTPRLKPDFMFACLKNFLLRPDLTPASLARNEQALRQEAEHLVFPHLRSRLGPLRLRRFRRDLHGLRKALRHREQMRMARTRLFGLFRDLYLETGRQLHFHDLLGAPRDIFYLTVEEIDAYCAGRSVQADLKALCESRKAEYARYEAEALPHHFITHGPPYHHNTYAYPYGAPDPAAPAGTFQGIGCSPGRVEAPVKLIFSPEDELSLDGQILCTVRTDPGWAPLFPTAGGLLIERGSSLSHSAVVAREFGIPAIVGLPNITRHLRTGDRVRMDGTTGHVQQIDE